MAQETGAEREGGLRLQGTGRRLERVVRGCRRRSRAPLPPSSPRPRALPRSVPHVLQHSLSTNPTPTASEFHELKPSSSVPVGWCMLASGLRAYGREQKRCRTVDAHMRQHTRNIGNLELSPCFLQRYEELQMQNLHD
uniref:Uncharacterized protein n=1 Tax=Oryza brachyantha TaxID=4533 RepID=J3NA59_ORYBR